jgi:hypothetical protein
MPCLLLLYAAFFFCEGTAGDLDDLGFGAGSAVMFVAASAPLLFHTLDYDGEGIGANTLRQSIADFVSDQPNYAIENSPLEDWVRWDSNRTPGAYANAMRSASKSGGDFELAINSIKKKCNEFVYEKKPDEPGAYRCISRFEFPGALKTKCLLYCGRNHYSVLKVIPKIMPKAGNNVAVELREGCGCRAHSDRDAYVGIAMDAS